MLDREQAFDSEYFSVYGNDPKRAVMYAMERDRILKLKQSGRILDIGCGIGAFLDGFSDSQWQKYGVDVSEHAVEIAGSKGINIKMHDEAYNYDDGFFDVIVMRGSVQHLPDPFQTIANCKKLLTVDGLMVFLSTPNTNSPYYRRFRTLPILTESLNILQPSDTMMVNALQNMGFQILDVRYPYLETPYAKIINDHLLFILSFFGLRRSFAFWNSMMEIYARNNPLTKAKPEHDDVR